MDVKSTPQTTPRNPAFAGMDARDAGLPVEACPYEPSPQRTAWVIGWYLVENRKEHAANGH